MSRRILACLALALIASMLHAGQVPARTRAERPRAYRVTNRQVVAPGLTHTRLRKTRGADQTVHVARLAPDANLRIQPVPSRGNATGRGPLLETTSKLCRRVRCVIAVNGDFYRSGRPVGALVLDGRPVRPFRARWVQAIFDPNRRLVAGRLDVRAVLLSSDLRRLRIPRIDPRRPQQGLTLYTAASGRRTPKRRSTVEAVFRSIDPRGPLRFGQSSVVRLAGFRSGKGRTRIPSNGMVLSARGRSAVRDVRALRGRARSGAITSSVLVRLRANRSVWDTVGGRPVLVRNGRSVVRSTRDVFSRGRHPRTIVGRTRDGSVLLVTIDGRSRRHAGMSLKEAARLMIRLGAVEAINLDGGGSTTFVQRGRVLNRPSDGYQRKVAVALAVVPKTRGVGRPSVPRLTALSSPKPEPATRPKAAPAATQPAIVAEPEDAPRRSLLPFAGMALVAGLGAAGRARRRNR